MTTAWKKVTRVLRKLAGLLDAISEWTGRVVSWLTLILVALTAYDVLARYLFKAGSVALQEMEWHIFSVIFLLGAAYTLKHDAHVRVDLVYAKLGERGKAVIDLLGSLLFLLPFCAVIIYSAFGFVESSWQFREGSGDPGGLPARYALKAMILLGFFLLGLQGVSQAVHSFLNIIKPPKAESHGGLEHNHF